MQFISSAGMNEFFKRYFKSTGIKMLGLPLVQSFSEELLVSFERR